MGLFEMKDMLQQARSMQKELKKKQKELSRMVFEGSSGGGMVTVKMSGKQQLLVLQIDPSLLSSGDAEMVQDLVKAAVNDSLRKAQEATKTSLSGMMGGAGGLGNLADMFT